LFQVEDTGVPSAARMDWVQYERFITPATELLNSFLPGIDSAFARRQQTQVPEQGRLCFCTCSCGSASEAGAAVASPVLLGVCSGLTQAPEVNFSPGLAVDPSEFPRELLTACRELAVAQLLPDAPVAPQDAYKGPISLLKEAYRATESAGSTTVLLAAIDNSSKIHGKVHPMVAVLSVGNCELLVLRRLSGPDGQLEVVFHPDPHEGTMGVMRQHGHPNPREAEEAALEALEEACAVHCITAMEGDVVILGDERVFGSLFLHEVVELCNEMLPASAGHDRSSLLSELVNRIAQEASYDQDVPTMVDSAAAGAHVVVGEIVEWVPSNQSSTRSRMSPCTWWECSGADCGRRNSCDSATRPALSEQVQGTGELERCVSPVAQVLPPSNPGLKEIGLVSAGSDVEPCRSAVCAPGPGSQLHRRKVVQLR